MTHSHSVELVYIDPSDFESMFADQTPARGIQDALQYLDPGDCAFMCLKLYNRMTWRELADYYHCSRYAALRRYERIVMEIKDLVRR